MKRLLLGVLAALCLLPAAAQAQVLFSTPPSCAKAGANTVTASAPVLDCTQTWNNSGVTFTGLKFNATDTASASASLLMDLQVAAASAFNISKTGATVALGGLRAGASSSTSTGTVGYYTDAFQTGSGGRLSWTSGAVSGTVDLALARDAANTLALRNGTSAQTLRVYNTYTDASNGEWGVADWNISANIFYVGTRQNGTGVARDFGLMSGGNSRWLVKAGGDFYAALDNTYDIGASGANRPRNVYVAGQVVTGGSVLSGGIVQVESRTKIGTNATDGNLLLTNNAGTSFGMLQFGGTTSSFPALKRNAAELDVRLADDSAPADLGLRHLVPLGTAPAVTACGTSPSIVGGDTAGEVTTGTATPTACTITFATAFATQPYCLVEDRTLRTNLTSYTVSTTAIVLTTAAASSQKVVYHCIGA